MSPVADAVQEAMQRHVIGDALADPDPASSFVDVLQVHVDYPVADRLQAAQPGKRRRVGGAAPLGAYCGCAATARPLASQAAAWADQRFQLWLPG